MADYQLYCFGESGNAYKAALMLTLTNLDWEPVFVDFFNGETRNPGYREHVNEMGEAPVLKHGSIKLSQSGVILDYLAEQSGQFSAQDDDHRREIWRWILFDNHKFTSYLATLRFLTTFAESADTAVLSFLRGRAEGALGIVDKHLATQPFMTGDTVTIADLSMCAYLFYEDELGLSLKPYANVLSWLHRIRSLPGWQHPYDLMPTSRRDTR